MVSAPRKIDADVAVIGDGLIGLSTALELRRSGFKVVVLGALQPGAATQASAGLLIPSLGRLGDEARPFFLDSLERYPGFVADLRRHDPGLSIIEGVVERGPDGETLHERDGAIDNVRLLAAVRAAASAEGVGIVDAPAQMLSVSGREVSIDGVDLRAAAPVVVVAAGAWSPHIAGLPRPLPVRPLKGQMIALGACPLDRAMMGPDVYLVPRGGETIVGATVEEAGFDITNTDAAIEHLRSSAVALCPELAQARVTRSWAGTRPATPDMLPILGRDPDVPEILYATGHSKNGILLAPGTATAIAAIRDGRQPPVPIGAFSVARFRSA